MYVLIIHWFIEQWVNILKRIVKRVPIKALQKIVFKEEMARAKDEMLGAKREVEEIEMEGGEEANSVEPILEGYNVYAQETMALFFQIVLIYFLTAWRNEIVIPIECARGMLRRQRHLCTPVPPTLHA